MSTAVLGRRMAAGGPETRKKPELWLRLFPYIFMLYTLRLGLGMHRRKSRRRV